MITSTHCTFFILWTFLAITTPGCFAETSEGIPNSTTERILTQTTEKSLQVYCSENKPINRDIKKSYAWTDDDVAHWEKARAKEVCQEFQQRIRLLQDKSEEERSTLDYAASYIEMTRIRNREKLNPHAEMEISKIDQSKVLPPTKIGWEKYGDYMKNQEMEKFLAWQKERELQLIEEQVELDQKRNEILGNINRSQDNLTYRQQILENQINQIDSKIE